MANHIKDEIILSVVRASSYVRDNLMVLNEDGKYEKVEEMEHRIHKELMEELPVEAGQSEDLDKKQRDLASIQMLLLQINFVIRDYVNYRPKAIFGLKKKQGATRAPAAFAKAPCTCEYGCKHGCGADCTCPIHQD